MAVVQVIESTAQALVEDSRGTESEGAVGADGEAISVDGSSLRWTIELELEVRCNVSGAALLVGELAVGEGDDEGSLRSWAGIALREIALGNDCRVDSCDLEFVGVGCHETCWSSASWADVRGNPTSLGGAIGDSCKGSESECSLHVV